MCSIVASALLPTWQSPGGLLERRSNDLSIGVGFKFEIKKTKNQKSKTVIREYCIIYTLLVDLLDSPKWEIQMIAEFGIESVNRKEWKQYGSVERTIN